MYIVYMHILYIHTYIFLKGKISCFSVASLEKFVVWETPPPPLSHAPDGPEIENDFIVEGGEGSFMWHLQYGYYSNG